MASMAFFKIFMLRDGTEALIREFLICINNKYFNLKLAMTCSKSETIFLDVLHRHTDGQLSNKPTAGNSILYASSFHPKPLLSAWALR